jgi:hypothetical protein
MRRNSDEGSESQMKEKTRVEWSTLRLGVMVVMGWALFCEAVSYIDVMVA